MSNIAMIEDLQAVDSQLRYLATIHGCPLLWNDATHQAWWADSEPQDVRYEADGSITIEPLCDVNRVPPWVKQPKPLDCGHGAQPGDAYVTFLGEDRDVCLSCASAEVR